MKSVNSLLAIIFSLFIHSALAQHPNGLIHDPLSINAAHIHNHAASGTAKISASEGSILIANVHLSNNGISFIPVDSNAYSYSGARAMVNYQNGGSFYPDSAVQYLYNIPTGGSPGGFIFNTLEEFTYATTNPLEDSIEVGLFWDTAGGGSWVPGDKYINTYNPSGTIGSQIYQYWDIAGSKWINDTKDSLTYGGSNELLSDELFVWDTTKNAWDIPYFQANYFYNSAHLETSEDDYIYSTSWTYLNQYSYTYDTSGNLLTILTQNWNDSSASWVNNNQFVYTYTKLSGSGTEYTVLYQTLYETWDATKNVWDMADMYVNTSFVNSMPGTTLNENWDAASHKWDTSFMTTKDYNSFNQYSSITNESWHVGVGWEYASGDAQEIFHYKTFTLSVKNIINNKGDANIYPVPSQYLVNIDLNWKEAETSTISVYDMTGRVIIEKQVPLCTQYHTGISVTNIPSGNYFVKITGATGEIVKQIVVAH